ncbi:MAG: hypothetical protein JNK07_16455 [Alphaproteobacteria bacterium]|nr:hypothetical protein [Alphaproteobacteria bacterium]
MSLDKVLGPATIVYLVSATVAALWWASDLTRRVQTVESSTVTAERIARLEVEVKALAEGTHELKVAVSDLVREIRR